MYVCGRRLCISNDSRHLPHYTPPTTITSAGASSHVTSLSTTGTRIHQKLRTCRTSSRTREPPSAPYHDAKSSSTLADRISLGGNGDRKWGETWLKECHTSSWSWQCIPGPIHPRRHITAKPGRLTATLDANEGARVWRIEKREKGAGKSG